MILPEQAGAEREAAILEAVRSGAYEPITWLPVTSEARGRRAMIYVAADALKIDGVRVNVTATTAQQIADLLGASLPTVMLVDLAWEQADVRCTPCLQPPGPQMASTGAMRRHSQAIDGKVSSRSGLIRTVGKDWVLHDRLLSREDVACNYGWPDPKAPYLSWNNEKVWQPLGTAHNRFHVDYSQTCTLVRRAMLVGEEEHCLLQVMQDSELSWLVSYDGAMRVTRMPGIVDTAAEPPPAPLPLPASTVPPTAPFLQAKNYTKGRIKPVGLIVLHTMEAAEASTTAENVAAWFAGAAAPQASAHFCVDADSVVQCVQVSDTAWAAPGANANGIQIEHAGYAAQSAAQWADEYSQALLHRSADLVARLCSEHSIPPFFVDAAGLLRGERGITTHAEVSKAFKKSTHTDPGPNFPMTQYLSLVRGVA